MKLIRLFFKNALMKELEYRKSFYIGVAAASIEAGMIVISTLFFFSIAEDIGGWNQYQYFILLGVLQILQGISYGVLYPNLGQLSLYINQGDLDYVLLKPQSSLYLISIRNYSIMDLPQGFVGVLFIVYGMLHLQYAITVPKLIVFGYLLFLSIIILYSLFLILVIFSFWTEKLSNIGDLWINIMILARFPNTVYKGAVKMFVTFVLPIAFMTTVPASVFVMGVTGRTVVYASSIALLFYIFGLGVWNLGLKVYRGAGA